MRARGFPGKTVALLLAVWGCAGCGAAPAASAAEPTVAHVPASAAGAAEEPAQGSPLAAAAALVRARVGFPPAIPSIIPTPVPPTGFRALAASASADRHGYRIALWYTPRPVALNAPALRQPGVAVPVAAFGARAYADAKRAAQALPDPPAGYPRPPAGSSGPAAAARLDGGVTAAVRRAGDREWLNWEQAGWRVSVVAAPKTASAIADAVSSVLKGPPGGQVWVDGTAWVEVRWQQGTIVRWVVADRPIPFAGAWRMVQSAVNRALGPAG